MDSRLGMRKLIHLFNYKLVAAKKSRFLLAAADFSSLLLVAADFSSLLLAAAENSKLQLTAINFNNLQLAAGNLSSLLLKLAVHCCLQSKTTADCRNKQHILLLACKFFTKNHLTCF